MRTRLTGVIGVLFTLLTATAAWGEACVTALSKPTPAQAWDQSLQGLQRIQEQAIGLDYAIETLATGFLAQAPVLVAGDSGGGKSYLTRALLMAEWRGLPFEQKQNFMLTCEQWTAEGEIAGFPKLNLALKGEIHLERKNTLAQEDYFLALLDEFDKLSPAATSALLSILNERKVFFGRQVFDLVVRAIVLTSNSNISQILAGYGRERSSGEAVLDRILLKLMMAKAPADLATRERLIAFKLKGRQALPEAVLQLTELTSMLEQVEIPDELLLQYSHLVVELDQSLRGREEDLEVNAYNRLQGVALANSFSFRTDLAVVKKVLKARFLVHQLMNQVPFGQVRWHMTSADLYHAATGMIHSGPGAIRPQRMVMERPIGITDRAGVLRWGDRFELDSEGFVFIYLKNKLQAKLHQRPDGIHTIFAEPVVNRLLAGIQREQLMKSSDRVNDAELAEMLVTAKSQPFEVEADGAEKLYLDERTTSDEFKNDLRRLGLERELFMQSLRSVLKRQIDPSELTVMPTQQQRQAHDLEASAQHNLARAESEMSQKWATSQLAIARRLRDFWAMDSATRAQAIATLSSTNVALIGRPGLAKTAHLQRAYAEEVSGWNRTHASDPTSLFFLQMHSMVPRGLIIGSESIAAQIERGEHEINEGTSMVARGTRFVVLDEAERAAVPTLEAYLAPGNSDERAAYRGHRTIHSDLLSIGLTSNKMPSEIVEMFGRNPDNTFRRNGYAFARRMDNIALLRSKPHDAHELYSYLKSQMQPLDRSPGISHLADLEALIDRVELPSHVFSMALQLGDQVMGALYSHYQTTLQAYRGVQGYSSFYFPTNEWSGAAQSNLLTRKWRAAFLYEQLISGIPFEKINWKMDVESLILLRYGMLYYTWIPVETGEMDGAPYYRINRELVDLYMANPSVLENERQWTEWLLLEQQTFVDTLNDLVATRRQAYQTEGRRQIQELGRKSP